MPWVTLACSYHFEKSPAMLILCLPISGTLGHLRLCQMSTLRQLNSVLVPSLKWVVLLCRYHCLRVQFSCLIRSTRDRTNGIFPFLGEVNWDQVGWLWASEVTLELLYFRSWISLQIFFDHTGGLKSLFACRQQCRCKTHRSLTSNWITHPQTGEWMSCRMQN